MDVFERLKKLREQLKEDIVANPTIQLTDNYKKMEQKYHDIITATDEIKNTQEVNQKQEERNYNEEANQKQEEVIYNQENNKEQEEIDTVQEDTQKNEELNLNVEENEAPQDEIQKQEENNETKEKKEEKVKDDILSFESMYREIFGKEPYGGRLKPEEPKKEVKEDKYKITEEDLSDNVSVFESIPEYQRPTYKFIGIAFKTYIILEMNNELYIMDQHAAHERILYEKVKKNFFSDTQKESQMLLLPDVITLTNKEMGIAKDNMSLFERAGFVIEEFGENTLKVSGVPEVCVDLDTKELFMETLDEVNTVARTAKQEKEEKFIATVACKAAVKANMALTEEEVTSLMNELLKLPNPFSCPHGRPTVIKMSKYDIERKFARK